MDFCREVFDNSSVSQTNGEKGNSRLDRIEKILDRHSTMIIDIEQRHSDAMDRIEASIERQVLANEAAHERLEREDKRLLTAQILMNGAMQKMAEGMTSLELKMEETTGKLNVLIETVDGVNRPKDPS